MNATELADALDWVCENHLIGIGNADFKAIATMLRQQQAEIDRLTMLCDCMTTESNRKGNEIEALKQIIDANNLNQNIGQFVKPTNEPVAWRCKKFYENQEGWFYNENGIGEPLYTHPVKELTDEEIANTWDDVRKDATLKPSMKDMQDFARAILRKAQEK